MDGNIILKPVVTREDAELTASLAGKIWTEHYTPIIGSEQVEYMLDRFQSADRIYSDITESGYVYHMAFSGDEPAGYCSARLDPAAGELFLSKLYVEKSFRGRGIARMFLGVLRELAESNKCSHIRLTVNKYNSNSLKVYDRLGFKVAGSVVTDIGGGFVMDDYVMRLDLKDGLLI